MGQLPLLMGILGISLAWLFYIKSPKTPAMLAKLFPNTHQFLLNKWYFDELYDFLFVNPAKKFGQFLWKFGDEKIIDGFGANGSALITHLVAGRASRLQTGFVYHYAFAMLLGFLAIMSYVVLK